MKLALLLIFSFPCIISFIGCTQKLESPSKPGYSVISYQPQERDNIPFNDFYLDHKENKIIYLNDTKLFASVSDTIAPSIVVRDWNKIKSDTANIGLHLDYWYTFNLINQSNDSIYGLQIYGSVVNPQLFENIPDQNILKEFDKKDGFITGKGLGNYFIFTLTPRSFTNMIIRLRTDNYNAISYFTIYSLPIKQKHPIHTEYDIILIVTVFLLAFQLYFFLISQNIIYLIYSVSVVSIFLTARQYLASEVFAAKINIDNGNFYFTDFSLYFLVTIVAQFIVLFLILDINKRSIYAKVFTGLMVLMILAGIAQYLDVNVAMKCIFLVAFVNLIFFLIFLRASFAKFHNSVPFFYFIISLLVCHTFLAFYLTFNHDIYYSLIFQTIEAVLLFIALIIGVQVKKSTLKKKQFAEALAYERNLAEKIIQVLEDERKRIAGDLHDGVGGTLAALKIKIQNYMGQNQDYENILSILDETSQIVRTISHDLMPPYFSETGLEPALNNYFSHLGIANDISFKFYYSGENLHFSRQQELMIYRIVMELVHNCIKHAQASEINVQLLFNHTSLRIVCEDNGNGFPAESKNGIGLQNLNSRVLYLGGKLTIDTNTQGTTVIIVLPFNVNKDDHSKNNDRGRS